MTIVDSNRPWSYTKTTSSVLKLAFPVALGRFLDRISPFAYAVMLAHIDRNHFLASAIITPFQMVLLSAAGGSLNTVNTLIGKQLNINDIDSSETKANKIKNIVQQGLIYSTAIGSVTVGLFFLNYPISELITKSDTIAQIGNQYFYGYSIGFLPYIWLNTYSQMTIGLSKPWPSVLANGLNSSLAIALGYFFTFGKFGFPQLGAFGLGLSSSIASTSVFVLFALYLRLSGNFKNYLGFSIKEMRQNFGYLNQLRYGIPIGLKIGFDRISLIITTVLAGALGHNALAAQEVCVQFLFVTMMPLFGLATTAGKYAAQHIKSNFATAQRVGNVTLAIGLVYTACVVGLYAAFSTQFSSLFLDTSNPVNAPILDLIKPTLLIIGGGQIFEATRSIIAGTLRGFPAPQRNSNALTVNAAKPSADTWYPMYLAIFIALVFDLAIGYLVSFPGKLGLEGVFGARSVGLLFASIILGCRWKYQVNNHYGKIPAGSFSHTFFRGSPLIQNDDNKEHVINDDEQSLLLPNKV